MTQEEHRIITDRINYILPYISNDLVKSELEDIGFQCDELLKDESKIVEDITNFIINYETSLKIAIIVKDKELISKCVKEWLSGINNY